MLCLVWLNRNWNSFILSNTFFFSIEFYLFVSFQVWRAIIMSIARKKRNNFECFGGKYKKKNKNIRWLLLFVWRCERKKRLMTKIHNSHFIPFSLSFRIRNLVVCSGSSFVCVIMITHSFSFIFILFKLFFISMFCAMH